jgi:hypothetical protein
MIPTLIPPHLFNFRFQKSLHIIHFPKEFILLIDFVYFVLKVLIHANQFPETETPVMRHALLI